MILLFNASNRRDIHVLFQAERKFTEAQSERRMHQQHLTKVQNELQVLNKQLEKLQRGDEKYLELVQQEVRIFKEQDQVAASLVTAEKTERDFFAELSSAVRESHEKERARAERTKYWSIIGSVIGALIGIFGTTINNYLRMRELRGLVTESAGSGTKLKALIRELSEKLQDQHNQMNIFVTDLRNMFTGEKNIKDNVIKVASQMPKFKSEVTAEQLEAQTKEIMQLIKKQDIVLSDNMKAMKRILASATVKNKEGDVVYVGPEIRGMFEENENNMEQKLKLNSLWTVTFVYGAFALTLPALYYIFKGT